MSRTNSILLTVGLAFLVGCGNTTVRENEFTFSFPDSTGQTVRHDDARFAGNVVLVDLWGAWCPGCHVQQPHLNRFYETYHEQGLEIVGINFEMILPDSPEERAARLQRYAEEHGIPYLMLTGGLMQRVDALLPDVRNIEGFPITIFIDRSGTVRAVETGFTDADAVRHEERIRELLNEPV